MNSRRTTPRTRLTVRALNSEGVSLWLDDSGVVVADPIGDERWQRLYVLAPAAPAVPPVSTRRYQA